MSEPLRLLICIGDLGGGDLPKQFAGHDMDNRPFVVRLRMERRRRSRGNSACFVVDGCRVANG